MRGDRPAVIADLVTAGDRNAQFAALQNWPNETSGKREKAGFN
jgi:hypothetical protein